MQHIIYLVLRRMRTPLILLVTVYAISVLGLVLIPGLDDQGKPWKMDFFHAFYFVSFMGSTIGFGEIPYPFTDAQRLWTLFAIYATVISWLYAIGTMLTLLQTPLFQAAVARNSFIRQVKALKHPFYIICGYGEAGKLVVNALMKNNYDCVVIDKDIHRINELELEDHPREVPNLNVDAADSDCMIWAGIKSMYCRGVIAVARDDDANLKVAIASKLLNPGTRIFCWAEHHDTEKNMASFGTDFIVNPYDSFADYFAMALHSPERFLLHRWLSSASDHIDAEPIRLPRGHWIICGFGRFGKAMHKKMLAQGLPVTIIEIDPAKANAPEGTIEGRGTEADTLSLAKVQQSVGIIAGTDNDVNNLSILLTARELKPEIFTIARQQHASNRKMFEAARLDIVTSNSTLIASSVMANIVSPITSRFLRGIREMEDEQISRIVDQLSACTENAPPRPWVISINRRSALAVMEQIGKGETVALGNLLYSPDDREKKLPCVALMLKRAGEELLLPEESTPLAVFDQILFAGHPDARKRIQTTLDSMESLHYIRTGEIMPSGFLFRWIYRKAGKTSS